MKKSYTQKIKIIIPEIVLLISFILIQISHINNDFWNDEIYTLKHFVFTSVNNTLLDYHVPNNHILFNLINNIYLRIFGVNSLNVLFDNPWKLRIVPFIYSFFTAYYTYKVGSKFINRTVGLLAVNILIFTLPYYNFSLQIRGYSLTMLLCVMLVYYLLSFIKYQKKNVLLLIGVLSCLLFYTIPSNLYFLFSITCVLFLKIFIDKINIKQLLLNKYSYLIYAITSGVFLALLCYLPIIKDVFFNEYVVLGTKFGLRNIIVLVLKLGYSLVYNRWLIILLSIFGFFTGYQFLKKQYTISLLCTTIIIAPLIIIWITGQAAPVRLFTFSLPFVSLLLATTIFAGIDKYFPLNKNRNWKAIFCVYIITIISFFNQIESMQMRMLTDIIEGGRSQDLYYQYYSAKYTPLKDIRKFNDIYCKNKLPVIADCEPHGLPNYLEKFKIPYYEQSKFDSILVNNDSLYIITNHPFKYFERNDIYVTIINPELSYHNSIIVINK